MQGIVAELCPSFPKTHLEVLTPIPQNVTIESLESLN